jgi:subfamily B ATP-binding cassette protein MsbA
MKAFWRFSRHMFRYRRLLVIVGIASFLAMITIFAGFGMLITIIDQIFGAKGDDLLSSRDVIAAKLTEAADKLHDGMLGGLVGDLPALADLIPEDHFWGFAFVLGVILVLTAFGGTMRFVLQSCALTISLRTVMRIRKAAFQRLIHAPYELLLTEGSADKISRIVRDTNQLGRGFNALLGKALYDLLTAAACLSWAFIIDWRMSLLFLIGAPVIALCIRKFGKKIRRASKRALRAYGWMLGAVQESTQAISVVKVHNAEGYERRRFNTINRSVLEQELKARTVRALSSPVVELIGIAGVMVVSLVAAWMVFRTGGSRPEDFVKVLLCLAVAGASLKPLAKLNNDLQESAAAAERIDEVLKLPVEANTRRAIKHQHQILPRHCQTVHFENVTYSYPRAQRSAVMMIDLEARHGQTIAIVGANGSGKSTLLNLLPRLIDPKDGRVTIDGTDIADISLRSLRKQIAVVTQQTVVFEGTIADNIAYGRRHTGLGQIQDAARAAYAHEFIDPLPDGYQAMLGEGGSGLSGGQKQRICIARAILRDPAILILDEATSQIDADSEAKINQALAAFRQGRTTFIIAHRLSTVVDADLIAVMVDGQIVDRGRHDELLKRCPTYQMLTRTQLQPPAT